MKQTEILLKYQSNLQIKYIFMKKDNKESFSYIIRFTWEIWIKWSFSRWNYIRKLSSNIEKAAQKNIISINHQFDKIILHTETNVDKILCNVFGITKFSKYNKLNFTDFDDLLNKSFEFFKDRIKWQTFAVAVKRIWNHSFTSMDLQKALGEKLFELWNPVNLKNPQIKASLEIHDDKVLLFDYTKQWPWWFPLGSVWRVPVLFSWGIDSAVCVWFLYRMWMDVDFIYYDLGWEDNFFCAIKVAQILQNQRWYWTKWSFWTLDLKDLIVKLQDVKPSYKMLILKYYFYKIAEHLCSKYWCESFATWEAINQVSTQIFDNLNLLNKFTNFFVIRPLVCMPKQQIMKYAKFIWTFDESYKWEEFCNISSKNTTKWSFKTMQKQINTINYNLKSIVENAKKVNIDNPWHQKNTIQDIETRQTLYIQRNKEDLSVYQNILYKDFKTTIPKLPKDKKYYITCKKWKLSKIVWKWMQDNWFDVVY